MTPPLARRLLAEATGSALLFSTVIGSGIMAAHLSGGNAGVALTGNTLATGAMLFVLITLFGPISGAHFNPVVTVIAAFRRELSWHDACLYMLMQVGCGIAGVWMTHLMFEVPILQLSTKTRTGIGQWTGEAVATFGLVLTIFGASRYRPQAVAASVALYIAAAYWFTSSTGFANPAITIARSLSDSFAGIALRDVPAFIAAQALGAGLGAMTARVLFDCHSEATAAP